MSTRARQKAGMALLDSVREARWFDARRANAYAWILLAMTLLVLAGWIATAHHGIDREGKPIGTDFLAFWSASRLALAGDPAAPYDLARIYAMERGSMPVDPGLSSFLYPPAFLLVCWPLGLAPYFVSLATWLAATGAAYWAVVKRWLGGGRGATLAILAYPAFFYNAAHGQNGFLTAALLGGGLWLLDRRPWCAGALLGLLVIKPQIAFALPVLVLASGRWRVMLGGIASAALLCAASWLAFGTAAWTGFLHGGDTARAIVEQGLVPYAKMVSLSAAVHVLGGGSGAAYAAQALLALGAAALLALVCRGTAQAGGAAALTAAATLLMSPFLLDYDLTTAAIPLAWLFTEGQRRGFLPWEKMVLLAGYLLPLFARGFATGLHLPVAPLVLVALALAVARAALWRPEAAATRAVRSSPSRH